MRPQLQQHSSGARVEIPELGGLWDVVAVGNHAMHGEWLQEKQRIDRTGMPDI